VYVKEVVGEVEALGSGGRGGSFFDDGDGFFGVSGEEVFSEEALVEVEWLDVEGFVYPGYVVERALDASGSARPITCDYRCLGHKNKEPQRCGSLFCL
jgi:hypothetical protein